MEDKKGGGLSWSQPKEPNNAPREHKRPLWEKTPSSKESGVVAVANTNAPKGSNRTTLIFIFLAVGGLILCGWYALSPGGNTRVENDTNKTTPDSVSVVVGELTTPPMQDAGFTVSVAVAAVTSPVWVVVYENRNGGLGNALGAKLFFPESTDGSVNLLRGTISGQTYFVGQRRDNGDRVFSLEKDLPVLDQSGKPILVQFQTR